MFYTEDVLYEFHVFVEHEYLHNCSVTYLHSSFRYNGIWYMPTPTKDNFSKIQMKCLAMRSDVFSPTKLRFNIQDANAANKQNCDESFCQQFEGHPPRRAITSTLFCSHSTGQAGSTGTVRNFNSWCDVMWSARISAGAHCSEWRWYF